MPRKCAAWRACRLSGIFSSARRSAGRSERRREHAELNSPQEACREDMARIRPAALPKGPRREKLRAAEHGGSGFFLPAEPLRPFPSGRSDLLVEPTFGQVSQEARPFCIVDGA